MNKFTLKDLISYNNPCIECGMGTNLQLMSYSKSDGDWKYPTVINYILINKNKLSFVLETKWANSLSLIIDPKNHEYTFKSVVGNAEKTDNKIFLSYLMANYMTIRISCVRCQTFTETSELEFREKYVEPLRLDRELLYLSDGKMEYYLQTSFVRKTTKFSFVQRTEATANHQGTLMWNSMGNVVGISSKAIWVPIATNSKVTDIELPELGRAKFKNKEYMLKKLRTYVMFS